MEKEEGRCSTRRSGSRAVVVFTPLSASSAHALDELDRWHMRLRLAIAPLGMEPRVRRDGRSSPAAICT
jgi:hypothetical protein